MQECMVFSGSLANAVPKYLYYSLQHQKYVFHLLRECPTHQTAVTLNNYLWYKTEKASRDNLWSQPFTPSLHGPISEGKKRDLNTGYLWLQGILYKSSCFFSFLTTKTKRTLCYLILSVKEDVFFWSNILFNAHTKCIKTPKKVFQQQQNRKMLAFRIYQLKIWWKLNDILRPSASIEPRLFCPFPCTHLHRPGCVAVTASTSTLSFGLWHLERECSHKA